MKPVLNRILIKKEETERKSAGGIMLPEHMKPKYVKAKVIEVGSGRAGNNGFIPMEVKKDDTILVGSLAGLELNIDNIIYHVINDEEVYLVL